MGQVRLNFEVDGEQQLSRFFEQIGSQIADFSEVFEKWGQDFRETQEQVFVSEGAFEGRGRWEDLSPRYAQWKDLHYPGQPILTASGRMRGSLTEEGHSEHIFDYKDDEMMIGTDVFYSIFHQRGTMKMPQRKVIELTQDQKLRWVQIARKTLWDQLKEGIGDATL